MLFTEMKNSKKKLRKDSRGPFCLLVSQSACKKAFKCMSMEFTVEVLSADNLNLEVISI